MGEPKRYYAATLYDNANARVLIEVVLSSDFDTLKTEYERVVEQYEAAKDILIQTQRERDRLRQELSGRASVQPQSTEGKDK